MKVVYIGVSDHFRNFIHLILVQQKQTLCLGDPYAVKVVVEVFASVLMKNLAEICAVISEDIRKLFKPKLTAVVGLNVLYNAFHGAFCSPAEMRARQIAKHIFKHFDNVEQA